VRSTRMRYPRGDQGAPGPRCIVPTKVLFAVHMTPNPNVFDDFVAEEETVRALFQWNCSHKS
jgi:hypothetical protein